MTKKYWIFNDFAYIEGGASKVAIKSACLLKDQGFDVGYVAAYGPITQELVDKKIDVHVINKRKNLFFPINYFWNIFLYIYLKSNIKMFKSSDVIVVHSWVKGLSPSVFQFFKNNKIYFTITLHDYFYFCPNGGLFNYKKQMICKYKALSLKCFLSNCDSRNIIVKYIRYLKYFLEKKIINDRLERKTKFISVSQFSKNIYMKLKPNMNIKVIHNPIEQHNIRIDAHLNKDYVYMGRLSPEKGVIKLAHISKKMNLPITFIGDGSCKNEILDINPDAKITGWVSDKREVAEILNNSRILLFPSLWYETQGLSVIEALCSGIPPIISDNSAATDYIKHNYNGLIFRNDDVLTLEECIVKSYDNKVVERLSRNAVESTKNVNGQTIAYTKDIVDYTRKSLNDSSKSQ